MENFKERKEVKQHTGSSKLISAIAMLLVSVVLLTGVSYAWLVLSVAPEVTGITTQIASNGALEIALLNSDTYLNPSKIKAPALGGSLINGNSREVNESWGNLLNVSLDDYGLSEIALLPARINIVGDADSGYKLKSGSSDKMLMIPTYAYDGRVVSLSQQTVSAVFNGTEFVKEGPQDYGVRAIGSSPSVTPQSSALQAAKTTIVSSRDKAISTPSNTMKKYGSDLIGLVMAHQANPDATFDEDDKNVLLSMLNSLNAVNGYIESALRYAVLGYAASSIDDTKLFEQVQGIIEDSSKDLNVLLEEAREVVNLGIPSEFATWVSKANTLEGNISSAIAQCEMLTGGTYTWAQIRSIMDLLINFDMVYIDETTKFNDMTASELMELMGSSFELSLMPGSGVFADIANFTGEYSTWMSIMGTDANLVVYPTANTNYLIVISEAINKLTPAGGDDISATIKIAETYGYALDMAFRCNAAMPDLLLQTEGIQRINEDSESLSTQGGGSYMEFSDKDNLIGTENMLKLLDAVRVAFIDNAGNVLGIAKLNLSNYTVVDEVFKAPLYLYDFEVKFDKVSGENMLVMDERRKENNLITALVQNQETVVSSLVWLDGDLVDNSMVSGEDKSIISGTLNLQFATSAELVPAGNQELLSLTPDKKSLNAAIELYRATYEGGQQLYSTVSWTEFTAAFVDAIAVSEDENVNDTQILAASTQLTKTAQNLVRADLEALKFEIDKYRELMGTTEDIARYVIDGVSSTTFTEAQKDAAIEAETVIYRVDYEKNLKDEGNGVKSSIYNDNGWFNLAAALYDAEYCYYFNKDKATQADIDNAISALDTAEKAMLPNTYFTPYEYNGKIYYKVIGTEFDEDSYGTWYYSDKTRVTSDLTIIKLDTHAVPVDIAKIINIPNIDHTTIEDLLLAPSVAFKTGTYSELEGETIKAVHWDIDDRFVLLMTTEQKVTLAKLIAEAESEKLGLASHTETLVAKAAYDSDIHGVKYSATFAEAASAIADLEAIVLAKKAELAESIDSTKELMTSNQRIVLTKAVASAKTVDGYNDLEMKDFSDDKKARLTALREATAAAETLLAEAGGVTMAQAEVVLTALNTQLEANFKTAVTEYNTIEYVLPLDSELFDVTTSYATNNSPIHVVANRALTDDNTGTANFDAVVLTESGIVFKIEGSLDIYAPLEVGDLLLEHGDGYQTSAKIEDHTAITLEAIITEPLYNDSEAIRTNYKLYDSIDEYEWTTSNKNVLQLTPSEDGTKCTITGISAGTATVYLRVRTDNDHVQTREFAVTVYMNKYSCSDCGWLYNEANGYGDIPAGTRFEDLPEYLTCPNKVGENECGATRDKFIEIETPDPEFNEPEEVYYCTNCWSVCDGTETDKDGNTVHVCNDCRTKYGYSSSSSVKIYTIK